MKKYLFTTLPSNDLGLLTRSLPIARELFNRGHDISFCSPARAPKKLISDAGFENRLPSQAAYYFIAGDMSLASFSRLARSKPFLRNMAMLFTLLRGMMQQSTAEIRDIDHFMTLFGMGHKDFVLANVNALVKVIEDYKPDAVVDFWNPFACIAARICGVPLITVIQADMHPQSQGFIWWKKPTVQDYPSPLSATNSVLAQSGLPEIRKTGELFVGDLTLVLGIPELDPLPDSANVTYIGPILWEQENQKLPARIANLDSNLPLIWLYPGNIRYMKGSKTPYDSMIVLEACLNALMDQPVNVIVTTGHHSLPKKFMPLPENVLHEPFVPGLQMADKCDLMIHHGGYGSSQTGLFTGTPALIIPTYSERESNARRIKDQGAGDYLLPTTDPSGKIKELSDQTVKHKIFEILNDPSFLENARRISKKMKSFGGAALAAQLIERVV